MAWIVHCLFAPRSAPSAFLSCYISRDTFRHSIFAHATNNVRASCAAEDRRKFQEFSADEVDDEARSRLVSEGTNGEENVENWKSSRNGTWRLFIMKQKFMDLRKVFFCLLEQRENFCFIDKLEEENFSIMRSRIMNRVEEEIMTRFWSGLRAGAGSLIK